MHYLDHTKNIIEVSDVSFFYGAPAVLKNISLKVHRGDYLGLIGPNGAGKTTLLKIMLGLLKPTSGSVTLFGQDLRQFNAWSKIGYVPQKAANFDQNFPCSVEEAVLMGLYAKRGLFHFVTKEDRDRAKETLLSVEMLPYKDRLIGNLSGGEQQRVFIARALVSDPEVIFLDEPTTGVDAKSREEFYAFLRDLNKTKSLTLVLISHDVATVVREAMHIAYINRTLTYRGSPEEFVREHGALVGYGV